MYAETALNVTFKKVIITGDSAGGNLAIAVTLMSVLRNFEKPDVLVPFYPSSINSKERFWPSLCNAFDDSLLSYSLLAQIQSAYGPVSGEI